jgi:hypothetical protein
MNTINSKIETFKTSDVQNLTTNDIKDMLTYLIDRSKKLDILEDLLITEEKVEKAMIKLYTEDEMISKKEMHQTFQTSLWYIQYEARRRSLTDEL